NAATDVKVSIVDAMGRTLCTSDGPKTPGIHKVQWTLVAPMLGGVDGGGVGGGGGGGGFGGQGGPPDTGCTGGAVGRGGGGGRGGTGHGILARDYTATCG